MAIPAEVATGLHGARALIWRHPRLQLHWPGRLRRLEPIGRWMLVGMLIGSIVAMANSWFLDTQITRLLLSQSTGRAMDHVQLGILRHVRAMDFVAPHTHEQLADLKERLDPMVAALKTNGSGTIDMDLVGADGIILYSDPPGDAGTRVPAAEQSLLKEALAGHVGSALDSAPNHPASPGRAAYDRTFDVYVPVIIDGRIAGAYEMDLALPSSGANQPLVLTLLGGFLGTASHLFLRLRLGGAQTRLRQNSLPAPADSPIANQRVAPPELQPGPGHLTERELQVLRLLASGHSNRGIATQLIVSEETIRSHVKRILRKTGQPNRTAAVTAALQAGIIDMPVGERSPDLA